MSDLVVVEKALSLPVQDDEALRAMSIGWVSAIGPAVLFAFYFDMASLVAAALTGAGFGLTLADETAYFVVPAILGGTCGLHIAGFSLAFSLFLSAVCVLSLYALAYGATLSLACVLHAAARSKIEQLSDR